MHRGEAITIGFECGDWIVRRGVHTLGAFAASACAVTFARTQADAAASSGARPRIVVDLRSREEVEA